MALLTEILANGKLPTLDSQDGRYDVTVAISCNLSDGVILGVDSAVTVPAPKGIAHVYEHGEKLFQVGDKSVGVAIYGLGSIRARTIGSYLKEFEVLDTNRVVSGNSTVENITEELRNFFFNIYSSTIVPDIESQSGKKFNELPDEDKPLLGLVIGGFSPNEYLSEVRHILIPKHDKPNSAQLCRKQGDFGTNWFSLFEPIRRYKKGFDPALVSELLAYFIKLRGADFSKDETKEINGILNKYEYNTPFSAMPIQDGIEYVEFLIGLVVGHYRFAVGAPVVGGEAQIGLVTLRTNKFEILEWE